jgi:predicted outer membrane repeat protein
LIVTIEQYHFKNNSAINGGVFSMYQNSSWTLVGRNDYTVLTMFEDNIVADNGGAIYAVFNSTITISMVYFLFRNNVAKVHGGVIFSYECTIKIRNSHYISNKATKADGGSWASFDSNMTLNNSDNPMCPMVFVGKCVLKASNNTTE